MLGHMSCKCIVMYGIVFFLTLPFPLFPLHAIPVFLHFCTQVHHPHSHNFASCPVVMYGIVFSPIPTTITSLPLSFSCDFSIFSLSFFQRVNQKLIVPINFHLDWQYVCFDLVSKNLLLIPTFKKGFNFHGITLSNFR